MASNPIVGPVILTRSTVKERFYPSHPTEKPIDPKLLNAHLRLLTDQNSDLNTAIQTIMQRLKTGSAPTGSVPASSSVSVKVPLPAPPYPNLNYAASAGVVGASLYIGDLVLATTYIMVTVINRDTVNPHSGTVSVQTFGN